ncbi:unnamed protein product, partial [Musa textilis]
SFQSTESISHRGYYSRIKRPKLRLLRSVQGETCLIDGGEQAARGIMVCCISLSCY